MIPSWLGDVLLSPRSRSDAALRKRTGSNSYSLRAGATEPWRRRKGLQAGASTLSRGTRVICRALASDSFTYAMQSLILRRRLGTKQSAALLYCKHCEQAFKVLRRQLPPWPRLGTQQPAQNLPSWAICAAGLDAVPSRCGQTCTCQALRALPCRRGGSLRSPAQSRVWKSPSRRITPPSRPQSRPRHQETE